MMLGALSRRDPRATHNAFGVNRQFSHKSMLMHDYTTEVTETWGDSYKILINTVQDITTFSEAV